MDYFARGGRPFLVQFPPCISHINACTKDNFLRKVTGSEPAATASERSERDESIVGINSGVSDLKSDERCMGASKTPKPPQALHEAFRPEDVKPWKEGQFEQIEKVQDAARNHGQVHVMRDSCNDRLVAVKKMPNHWVQKSHSEFIRQYPFETEQPWQDIGCNHFLSTNGYAHGCRLLGVYRGPQHTSVVTEFASEGDLFSWCGAPTNAQPGPAREGLLKPLALQILNGVKELHEMAIVHRDISLENLVMSKGEEKSLKVCVIDFGMSSTARFFRNCVSGKPSYQAPEFYSETDYDAFLSDAFAVGISLYAAFVKDYPWLSTKPGGCKCFDYFRRNGFRKYIAKRKLRGFGGMVVADVMSEPLVQLLEGLLSIDPAARLTLGESFWETGSRRSALDEPWLYEGSLSPDSEGPKA
uniref:Protein kinase domain-containing protein n=1 Tax=Alexandrium monilatum TaxID=311494 RepID=A0A7S4W7R2_9DINO